MIVSSPALSVCSPLQPELWKLTGKRLCISSDRSCHRVFSRENKRKTERKLFMREHRLQCCALFSASLFSTPPQFVFHLFLRSFFPHSVRSPLSLSTSTISRSQSPFFSLSPLSAAVTDFFLPRLKYEYFRAKKLKGNNEMAPKLNYTPFPESQKRDFSE